VPAAGIVRQQAVSASEAPVQCVSVTVWRPLRLDCEFVMLEVCLDKWIRHMAYVCLHLGKDVSNKTVIEIITSFFCLGESLFSTNFK